MKKYFFLFLVVLMFGGAVFGQGTATASTTPAASTSNKPKRGPVFRPSKDQIKQVQTMLKNQKLYEGEASGNYNDETRTGIKTFQSGNGLKQTGTLNRATLEKMDIPLTDNQKLIPVSQNSFETASTTESKPKAVRTASTSGTAPSGTKTSGDGPKKVIFRATADQVKEAQKMLKAKAMYAGEETGKLDDATRDSLKKFQEANEIKVTGTLNAVTLEKMGIALTDKQKTAAAAMPK